MYFPNTLQLSYDVINLCPYTSLANLFVFLYQIDANMRLHMNESHSKFFQSLKLLMSQEEVKKRNQMFFDFLMKVVPENLRISENGFINMETDTLSVLRVLFEKHTSMVLQNQCDLCSLSREIRLLFVSAISATDDLKEMKTLMMKTSERTSLICCECKQTMRKSVRFENLVFVNTYRDEKFINLTLNEIPLSFDHDKNIYELKGLIHCSQRHFSCYAKGKKRSFWFLDDDGTQRLVEDVRSEKANPEILIYVKQSDSDS